jgi:hypothetical protein
MNKCLERVNVRHFWNPGVFSYALTPVCHPNSRFFFSSSHLIVYAKCRVMVVSGSLTKFTRQMPAWFETRGLEGEL